MRMPERSTAKICRCIAFVETQLACFQKIGFAATENENKNKIKLQIKVKKFVATQPRRRNRP